MTLANGHITAPKPLLEFIASTIFRISGWSIQGKVPAHKKMVIVIAYHTSNWDFVYLMCAKFLLRMHVHWFGKHSLFKKPFAAEFERWGGIPVRRHLNENLVSQAIAEFDRHEYFALGMAPEGTRSKVSHWKTGFYSIAKGAGAVILPAALDFKNKRVVIGEIIEVSESRLADFRQIYQFFKSYQARYPELACSGDAHLAELEVTEKKAG